MVRWSFSLSGVGAPHSSKATIERMRCPEEEKQDTGSLRPVGIRELMGWDELGLELAQYLVGT